MASEGVRDRSRSPARRPAATDPPSAGKLFEPAKFKYVDKTFLLARLLTDEGPQGTSPYLFAPAPRRVGKTTTVEMLAAMARGEKDKFAGMAVMRKDSPFKVGEKPFQVVRLNFSGLVHHNMKVERVLSCVHSELVTEADEQHGIKVVETQEPSQALESWLRQLKHRGHDIVVLIDEYDAPITAFLPRQADLAEDVAQTVFKPFYEVLKNANVYKVFITGVANFAATSLFSGANNIANIMKEDVGFATLFGFTKQEIKDTYAKHIEDAFGAGQLNTVLKNLTQWYNGYRVHPEQADDRRVYNPWSVLKYFQSKNLQGYWADTCMQTSLVEMIGLRGIWILDGYTIHQSRLFANIAVKQYLQNWQQVAFHSGYATIVRATDGILEMRPPNKEVREWLEQSMSTYLIGTMTQATLESYVQALARLDLVVASRDLQAMLRSRGETPLGNEADFTNFVVAPLLLAKPLGIGVDVEVFSQRKQALAGERLVTAKVPDLILWFRSGRVIVMELKFNRPVAEGVNQIAQKEYMKRARAFIKQQAADRPRSHPPLRSFHGLAVACDTAADDVIVEFQGAK